MDTTLCKSCGSCGFPMRTADDFAGGNLGAAYCSTCANADGNLKPFPEVVAANAHFLVREQGVDERAARKLARELLLSMPAWKHEEA